MKPRVIILGGGIGGICAALALLRAGVDVHVYERVATLREVGAGLGVWTNAMRVLDRLGVGERVRAIARPLRIAEIASSSGKVLMRTDIQEAVRDDDAANFIVHRADLHNALVTALPEDRLHLGASCTTLVQDARGVTVSFADGDVVWADLAIGADGLHSVVRTALWGEEALRYSGQTCYRGIAAIPPPEPQLIREIQGPGRRAAVCPMDDSRVYWWAAVNAPEGERDVPRRRREVLLDAYAHWPFELPSVIAATEGPILRNDLVDRAPRARWGRGRVTLLGDAAHPMLPNLGQGACTAIEDGLVLARCLLQHGVGPDALVAYERERVPRTTAFVRQSWNFGVPVRWTNPAAVWARETLMRLVPNALLDRQLRLQTGFDVGPLHPRGVQAAP